MTNAATMAEFAKNPIIYHLITDRFLNAEPGRPAPYGRPPFDPAQVGGFHGGNFAGVTRRLREGWFQRLGVNAILLSPPYEQIHGWVPGGGGQFRHFGYHGYYALDFTVLDRSFGTVEELRELIAVAHAQGIRVLLDVVMNHPGYEDVLTLHQLGIGGVRPGWEQATPVDVHRFVDYDDPSFARWWGPDWIRSSLPGHEPGGSDDWTMQLAGLPDFRTESPDHVGLPAFLRDKPDTRAVELAGTTVRGYLVKWLSDWVREFGIDGFRCDSAKHVEPAAWCALKAAATQALRDWKAANPGGAIDDAPFWMMGEVFGNGTERNDYFDNGFDSLLNFQFQAHLDEPAGLDAIYARYTAALRNGGHQFVSYISSHDTRLFERADLVRGALSLLLAPGGVLIFYGDETARPPLGAVPGDSEQATRSYMNWDAPDQQVLGFWQRLGQFRARHPALACGSHRRLGDGPYAFVRFDAASDDLVVIVVGATAGTHLPVAGIFHDGEPLFDAFSGCALAANAGAIALHDAPVMLIERRSDRDTTLATFEVSAHLTS